MKTKTKKKPVLATEAEKLPAEPPAPSKWQHIRPGIILCDENSGSGLAVVLKMLPDGRMLILSHRNTFYTVEIEDYLNPYSAIPGAGSIFDKLADHVAALFPLDPETAPFGPRALDLPILNTPEGRDFQRDLFAALRMGMGGDCAWTVRDVLGHIEGLQQDAADWAEKYTVLENARHATALLKSGPRKQIETGAPAAK